jgi:hypothetical protein
VNTFQFSKTSEAVCGDQADDRQNAEAQQAELSVGSLLQRHGAEQPEAEAKGLRPSGAGERRDGQ